MSGFILFLFSFLVTFVSSFGERCEHSINFNEKHRSGLYDVGYVLDFPQGANITLRMLSPDADMIYEVCDRLCDRERVFKAADKTIAVYGHKLRIEFVDDENISSPRVLIRSELKCSTEWVRRYHSYYAVMSPQTRIVSPQPTFVSMREGAGLDLVWTVPVRSVYGVNSMALAGGSTFYVNHEYVKFREFEDVFHVVFVPSFGVSSLYFKGNSPWFNGDGQAQGFKQIFRYSARDACWFTWYYPENRPSWNGDISVDDFRQRTGVAPSTIGAQVYNIDPPTRQWLGHEPGGYYYSNGTIWLESDNAAFLAKRAGALRYRTEG